MSWVVVTPNTPQYSVFLKEGIPPEVLLREPFIQREAGSGTRRAYERFLAAAGINTEQMRVVAELEDPESVKRSVARGLGISILSRRAIEEFCSFGLLLALPLTTGVIERRLYIGCRKGARLSSVARTFLDETISNFQKNAGDDRDIGEKLGLEPARDRVVSIAGAGGKTTLMFALRAAVRAKAIRPQS